MIILVVDDHAANRKLLRVQLEAEDFSVLEAADGANALDLLAHEPVDAVISDILMPRIDGYRLCHEVRKNPSLQHLRFILYSSTYTSPRDVRLSDTVGADRFIAKPAPIAVILGALQLSAAGWLPRSSKLPTEEIILQQYSTVLVGKLEEKNAELKLALTAAHGAHVRIQELNASLEDRVRERTAALATANRELTAALTEVKQLNGLLPICSYCKRIRDDMDYWETVETYIARHTNSRFSHGVCPACCEKHHAPALRELGIGAVAEPGGHMG